MTDGFRRRFLLRVGAVALLGVAGLAFLLWIARPTPDVTWDNFRRLREGMSEWYVEALLGKPHDVSELGNNSTTRIWQGEGIAVCLIFGGDRLRYGIAGSRSPGENLIEGLRTDESFLDRIRRWLHL